MTDTRFIKLCMGIIGIVVGTIFLIVHFFYSRKIDRYFSHNNKAETIVSHLKKYFFLGGAFMFYSMSLSGFIWLFYN